MTRRRQARKKGCERKVGKMAGTLGKLRLGVNIDHVATVRNARGASWPDPLRAALLAEASGADGITAHLREDRRHIRDEDIEALMAGIGIPLNFECAATEEMQALALRLRPHAVCLVPEKREERTTEGGLDVASDQNRLADFVAPLRKAGCRVSMFIALIRARSRPAPGSARRWWNCTPGSIRNCMPRGALPRQGRNWRRCAGGRPWRTAWGWRCMPGMD